MMNWQDLINPYYKDNTHTSENTMEEIRSPYLKDIDRLIYCKYFRKLQDKTQVYPLSSSDYVRTRLTHSLEVAGVGRSLGLYIGQYLINKYNLENITPHDFGYVLQAAGLAHDIGNPPFGHLSEDAISVFFKNLKSELLNYISEKEYLNLINFDGNAQGFRTLVKLSGNMNKKGLNLTYTTLGVFCKYPTFIQNVDAWKTKNHYIGAKKIGVFEDEINIFLDIQNKLQLIPQNIPGSYTRHPLTFLIEAADDICYCIADIEDSYFVNITTFKEIEKLLAPIARHPEKYGNNASKRIAELRQQTFYKFLDYSSKIEWLRGKAIYNLIQEVKKEFLTNEHLMLKGEFNQSLLSKTIFHQDIEKCKKFAKEKIFNSQSKLNAEIIGINAVTLVLQELYKVIHHPNHPRSKRINQLIGKIISTDKSMYQNLVSILDLIANFTDRNILNFSKILKV